jgi:hypothetical protein
MLQTRALQSHEVLVKKVPSDDTQKEVTLSVCPLNVLKWI